MECEVCCHLKQMLPKTLALVIFMHIEIQDTDWLYLTKGTSFNTDEQLFASGFDAAKDSQPA